MTLKNIPIYSLALLFLTSCTAPALPPSRFIETVPPFTSLPALPEPNLAITVDPRLELLAVVQSLSDYEQRTGLITDLDFAYKQKVAQVFGPYREHAAVNMFDELSQAGFSFDGPPYVMLFLSSPPELDVQIPFPAYAAQRAGGMEKLEAFVAALRDFARESDFMQFYTEHTGFYQEIAAGVEALVNPGDLALLEEYYGMRQHSYNIILVPLFHAGGFGPRLAREDGTFDVYSINGPHTLDGDLLTFGSPEDFRQLIWHEFSHSFINPLVEQAWEEIKPYSGLYAPIEKKMRKQAYEEWQSAVNEHLIRAITARLAAREFGPEAGRRALETDRRLGFRYIDALADRLVEYEANRDRYPTLESFIPRLLAVFAELSRGE
jgi:hypothetical protein